MSWRRLMADIPIRLNIAKSMSADGLFFQKRPSADDDFEGLKRIAMSAIGRSRTWEPPLITVHGNRTFRRARGPLNLTAGRSVRPRTGAGSLGMRRDAGHRRGEVPAS